MSSGQYIAFKFMTFCKDRFEVKINNMVFLEATRFYKFLFSWAHILFLPKILSSEYQSPHLQQVNELMLIPCVLIVFLGWLRTTHFAKICKIFIMYGDMLTFIRVWDLSGEYYLQSVWKYPSNYFLIFNKIHKTNDVKFKFIFVNI